MVCRDDYQDSTHSHHPRQHNLGALEWFLAITSWNTSSHGHYDDGNEKCRVNEILDKRERNAA
jgi:hypothetical protein